MIHRGVPPRRFKAWIGFFSLHLQLVFFCHEKKKSSASKKSPWVARNDIDSRPPVLAHHWGAFSSLQIASLLMLFWILAGSSCFLFYFKKKPPNLFPSFLPSFLPSSEWHAGMSAPIKRWSSLFNRGRLWEAALKMTNSFPLRIEGRWREGGGFQDPFYSEYLKEKKASNGGNKV